MDNEGQQGPHPSQQANYYGWTYEQDDAASQAQPLPTAQPFFPGAQPGPLPEEYQQPVADMGSSLGYNQSMDYQYFNVPQPSQPIPMLRQTRLQQLREARTQRRQHPADQHIELTDHVKGLLRKIKSSGPAISALRSSLQSHTMMKPTQPPSHSGLLSQSITRPPQPAPYSGQRPDLAADPLHPSTPSGFLSNPMARPPQPPSHAGPSPDPMANPFQAPSPSGLLPNPMAPPPQTPSHSGLLPTPMIGRPPLSLPGTPGSSPSQTAQSSAPQSGLNSPIRPALGLPASTTHHLGQSMSMRAFAASASTQDTSQMQRIAIRRAAFILTGAFAASRVLGMVRSIMFATIFGTTAISDAYNQAFNIPNTIYSIVAGGALSSAFIPVFTQYMEGNKDEKTAWHITSSALNLVIAIMLVVATLAFIFMGPLIHLYTPQGDMHAQDYVNYLNLVTLLARIMLAQAIILGAGAIISSVLNARNNFLFYAIGTVVYNVGLIFGLLPGLLLYYQAHPHAMPQSVVVAAAWGIVLGALLQVAVQVPGLFKIGMRYSFSFDWRHPGVIQIGRQMVPRIINASVLSISIFVDVFLIQLVARNNGGSLSQYIQANQLFLLPLSIFGMAVGTAAFPTLAENVAKGRLERVRSTLMETLRSILFLSVPSSIGLIVLGLPLIQVLFQHGNFDSISAHDTTAPLTGFAIGLAAMAAIEILTRTFYAMRDSKTPVIISIAQFGFKIVLGLVLINIMVNFGPQWGPGALALSTSLAGILEAAVLLWLLHQRLGGLQLQRFGTFLGRLLLASLAMGLVLFVLSLLLDALPFLSTGARYLGLDGTIKAAIKLTIELFVGAFIYIRAARYLGIEELGPVKRVLDRLKLSWI